MMKRTTILLIAAAIAIIAVATLFHASTPPPGVPPLQQKEREAENESSNTLLNGATVVTLSAAAQGRAGIQVVPLAATTAQRRTTAAALVLSAAGLAAARNSYVAAQAKLEKSRVSLDVSQQEFARVSRLFRDDQNVSEKAFQAAQGSVNADRIDVQSSRTQLNLQREIVQQNWGPVVAGWVANGSQELGRVVQQEDFLIQVTIPLGESFRPPATAWLALPDARGTIAHFVSLLPRVDPRVQGTSVVYLSKARGGLAPGLTLLAQLPEGSLMRGVVVPASAVVWSEGAAWVYVETSPNSFVRRPFSSDFSLEGGYFASKGFQPGDKVVVAGAQILLSDELSPKGAAQAPSDEDDD